MDKSPKSFQVRDLPSATQRALSMSELCYLTATAVLSRFRARALSPQELLEALIARAGELQPRINCFADCYFDEALAAARAAGERYAKGTARPLEGVPLTVKDAQRVNGRRTTHGSLIFMDAQPETRSDPMIERLEAAGAIVFARTTTPEFCLSGVCHSRAWGVTRNPWNLAYGPGGSSGGSGAALAAGMTTLATGTDIGGSIRIPASACGVVGFKPPHGRNPDGPPANFDRFNHCGPMTRSVADAALMQAVTAGPHPLDHDSLRHPPALPSGPASIRGMRIALSLDFGYTHLDADVRANTLAAADLFRAAGATVEPVDLGWTRQVDDLALHWYNTMHFGRQTLWWRKTHGHLMTDYALKMADALERATGIDDVHKTWEMIHRMYQSLGPVLERHDLLLCPTLSVPAVPAEHDPWDASFTVNGVKADPEYGWVMTHPFNMLHNCPVMALPSGRAASGVPTGIQLVGRTWDDATVFRAAYAYEAACGGWYAADADRPTL
jgi:Asp-tRNA(Asn)/Glu-tRNA(Gln) amidotransferase A subunit family amidase